MRLTNISQGKNRRSGIVLLAGSVLQLLFGMLYAWSVFVNPISETFGWSVQDVKFTVNIVLCCYSLGVLIGGKLQSKMKVSYILLTGGLMMSAGMFITSILPIGAPVICIWITYGVIGGFGVGLVYNTVISTTQKWFSKKRGVATGVSVFAFGFSSVVFAPVVEVLTRSDKIGLIMTFRILALIYLVATVGLFRFIKLPEDVAGENAVIEEKKAYTTREMLKTFDFYLVFFAMMSFPVAFMIINPSLQLLAPIHGLSASFGVVLVMIAGLSNSFGRLLLPVLGEKIGRLGAMLVSLIFTTVGTVLLCFVNSWFFAVVIAIIAFCYGGISSLFPVIVSDRFGLKYTAANYGAVMIGYMISSILFPFVIGQLNTTGAANNIGKYIALASVAAISTGLVAILILRRSKE